MDCYELTRNGCLILASGYNALLRERIINRLEELEKTKKNNWNIPQSYSEDLLLASNFQYKIGVQEGGYCFGNPHCKSRGVTIRATPVKG